MAWTTSANPWGSFDLADAAERNRALGLNWLNSVKKIGIRGGLRIAGGVHLALLVNWAGTDASGLAAMLSGLAMMTLAWVPTAYGMSTDQVYADPLRPSTRRQGMQYRHRHQHRTSPVRHGRQTCRVSTCMRRPPAWKHGPT